MRLMRAILTRAWCRFRSLDANKKSPDTPEGGGRYGGVPGESKIVVQSAQSKMLGVEADMIFDKGRDEIVAVVIAILNADGDRVV